MVTTCVAAEGEAPAGTRDKPGQSRLSPSGKIALRALQAALAATGENAWSALLRAVLGALVLFVLYLVLALISPPAALAMALPVVVVLWMRHEERRTVRIDARVPWCSGWTLSSLSVSSTSASPSSDSRSAVTSDRKSVV